MMDPRALRKVAIVIISLSISCALLRTQLSSALVTRGDALAYWGDQNEARAAYKKALFFDPLNGVAADRYAFSASMTSDRQILESCVAVASTYLLRAPDNSAILMDRALCYQHQRFLAAAIKDFSRVGETARDARAFMFAALDERVLHQSLRARRLLRKAVLVDPQFLPARRELGNS